MNQASRPTIAPSPRRLLAAMATVVGGMACPLGAAALDLPSQGVICDQPQRICYDKMGASLSQTRRHFGRQAEQQLLRSLSGRPPEREFQFSSGEVCDLRRQVCWDDGWRRSNISNRLTRQLFGTSNSAGWGEEQADRRCRLSQRGRMLFSGSCSLTRRTDQGGRAYVVETRDGRLYSFSNRSGRLELRDATGTWPVSTSRRDNAVVFRWADLQLEAYRPQDRSTNPTPAGNSDQLIQQLIEGLFR